MASATRQLVIVADASKQVKRLGKFPLPVEVTPFGWELTNRRLIALGCTPHMSMVDSKPFLTDNSHYILDCSFGPISDPALLHEQVSAITGVMEDGFFINMADIVVVGSPNGDTRVIERAGK